MTDQPQSTTDAFAEYLAHVAHTAAWQAPFPSQARQAERDQQTRPPLASQRDRACCTSMWSMSRPQVPDADEPGRREQHCSGRWATHETSRTRRTSLVASALGAVGGPRRSPRAAPRQRYPVLCPCPFRRAGHGDHHPRNTDALDGDASYRLRRVGMSPLAPSQVGCSHDEPDTGQDGPDDGYRPPSAQPGRGRVTFYNAAPSVQTIAAGTLLTGKDGVEVVTDQDAVIPAGTLATNGQVTVAAHAVNLGPSGNIAAQDIYGRVLPGRRVRAE